MTKDQKRIKALEKEVEDLKKQVFELAMRTPFIYYTNPITYPVVPYMPEYPSFPIVTCGTTAYTDNVTVTTN